MKLFADQSEVSAFPARCDNKNVVTLESQEARLQEATLLIPDWTVTEQKIYRCIVQFINRFYCGILKMRHSRERRLILSTHFIIARCKSREERQESPETMGVKKSTREFIFG